MQTLDEAFPAALADAARGWFGIWGLGAVAAAVRVRFSRRMYRTVGRCWPERREVAFASAVQKLAEPQQLAILCHEFAHIAAWEHHGHGIRPHGPQWRSLVLAAGFEPSVRFDHEPSIALLNAHAPRRRRYLHVCPRCRSNRISARRMLRWRCGVCYETGRDGRLDIIPVDA